MELLPLVLVLLGSLLHLGWNVLAKAAGDRLAFLWLALLPPAAAAVPLLGDGWLRGGIAPAGWACLLASSLIHAVYFSSLASAYGEGDLSFVYSYSRGLGTLAAALAGAVLLGELPSFLGWLGIALILAATAVEPLAARVRGGGAPGARGLALTLWTGLSIGGYFLVDKIGVSHVPPTAYLAGQSLGAALLLSPSMLSSGRALGELRRSRARPLLGMLFLSASYWLVLEAMQSAPVGYVAAVRSGGILASGAAGVMFLGEAAAVGRWLALSLIVAGICCLGLA